MLPVLTLTALACGAPGSSPSYELRTYPRAAAENQQHMKLIFEYTTLP